MIRLSNVHRRQCASANTNQQRYSNYPDQPNLTGSVFETSIILSYIQSQKKKSNTNEYYLLSTVLHWHLHVLFFVSNNKPSSVRFECVFNDIYLYFFFIEVLWDRGFDESLIIFCGFEIIPYTWMCTFRNMYLILWFYVGFFIQV